MTARNFIPTVHANRLNYILYFREELYKRAAESEFLNV